MSTFQLPGSGSIRCHMTTCGASITEETDRSPLDVSRPVGLFSRKEPELSSLKNMSFASLVPGGMPMEYDTTLSEGSSVSLTRIQEPLGSLLEDQVRQAYEALGDRKWNRLASRALGHRVQEPGHLGRGPRQAETDDWAIRSPRTTRPSVRGDGRPHPGRLWECRLRLRRRWSRGLPGGSPAG